MFKIHVTLTEAIDAALASADIRQQQAREKQKQMATMCQTRKVTPAEIEMYGDIMHDHFAQITAK